MHTSYVTAWPVMEWRGEEWGVDPGVGGDGRLGCKRAQLEHNEGTNIDTYLPSSE